MVINLKPEDPLNQIIFMGHCSYCGDETLQRINIHAVQIEKNLTIVANSICSRCGETTNSMVEKVQIFTRPDGRIFAAPLIVVDGKTLQPTKEKKNE